MYNEDYFYGITDVLHFNVYAELLKDKMKYEERVIIKVFKKDDNLVVMENNKGEDIILKDTRKDKNDDVLTYDLVFLRTLNRYASDYEMPGMVYEYVDGIGSWFKVKIDGYKPNDKMLKPFFLKKKIKKEDLKKYASSSEDLEKLENFYDLTKGLLKFSKVNDVKKLFSQMEE